MGELISNNIYLILLLPLWIFLIIMLGRFVSVYVNKSVIWGLSLFSAMLGCIASLSLYKIFTPDMVFENTIPFIKINDFIINLGIHIDRLSLIFTSVLFIISFFVLLFSTTYMKNEKKQYRFYALINLFNFVTATFFFSPNLFQAYGCWELVGLISYLLIGFEYSKSEKSLASKKVFIINRIGDTAFLAGIIMCSYLMYEYAPSKSLAGLDFFDMNTISVLVSVYSPHTLYLIICGLFIVAAMVKSAQFPFYSWLQDAMEAKLPVSALLHSSTLVALGVYLVIRIMPFLTLTPSILKFIAIIGVLTAFVCSLSASVQNHPKKALAYSTSAQFGLIFFALGILNIKVALILFVTHALIKSMLFLTLPDEKEKWNILKFILFTIGALSLAGLLFSGLCAKEIFAASLALKGIFVLSILSFITAFYILRLLIVVMKTNGIEKINSKKIETFSAFSLLFINILLYIYLRKTNPYHIDIPYFSAILGVLFVLILNIRNWILKISCPLFYNGFYIDKFYMTIILWLYNKFAESLAKFDTKILGNYKPIIYVSKIGVNLIDFVETKIMNGVVNEITKSIKKLSEIDLKAQNGNIQRYNLYAFLIITIIITILSIAYLTIIINIKGVG